jgi:hypothetical protein
MGTEIYPQIPLETRKNLLPAPPGVVKGRMEFM